MVEVCYIYFIGSRKGLVDPRKAFIRSRRTLNEILLLGYGHGGGYHGGHGGGHGL